LGLPDDKKLYICVQTLIKFHPDFDDILARILEADPQGEIILLEGLQVIWTDALKARLKENMPQVFHRIRFLPQLDIPDFLSLLNEADVILDTPYYGGGMTTYEALAVGTPVVTLAGASMKGRYSLGCYETLGISEPTANTVDEYVAIALRIANDPVYRDQLRQTILARNSALFENMAVIREMEILLQEMVHQAEHREK
jgi:predicted O-linked N-acetylglucosamine transferase (SPINDLY family)